ncbi:MAG TPA: tetratricopeptide repeat protein, partial [Crenotrichaceae bacterium]|nr:tetratricopeptide repeat protein [Crenotrichaceae bacterium]
MRFRSSFLLVVMLSACTQLDEEPLHSSIDNRNNQSGTLNNNPCSIALTALDHNQSSQNISRYQHAILRNHQALANLEKLGWAFVEKARTSFDPGFYKLAEQTVACLIQKQPENVNALMLKSHILHNLHRFKDAELVARQVVAQRGSWFEYAVLGDALMEQGKLDQAALAYQHMVDQRPGPQSYSRAAHLRWLFGDLDGAIELMALAVQAHVASGSESTAWFQTRLAMYLFQAGQLDSAKKILTTTLARHSTYAPALLVLGRIHLAQENHAQAVKIFTIAETINP